MTALRPFSSLTMLLRRFPLYTAVGVVVVLLSQFFSAIRVLGNSMNPTLQHGQILLSYKRPTTYQRGDVVILRPPRDLQARASRFVKRLVAMPGDTVSIQNDKVFLNEQFLEEPYATETSTRAENFPELLVSKGEVVAFEGFALAELPEYLKETLSMLTPLPREVLKQSYTGAVSYVGTIKLAENFYFVLGDNRGFSASEDSRLFGVISKKNILGMIIRP
jgi:signal peptidase I